MSIKIPKTIKVGSQLYQIRYFSSSVPEKYGYVDYRDRSIYINSSIRKRDQRIAFFHELLHVCDNYSGNSHNEEFITKISPTIASVFEINSIQRSMAWLSVGLATVTAIIILCTTYAVLPRNICVSGTGKAYVGSSVCSRFDKLNIVDAVLVRKLVL